MAASPSLRPESKTGLERSDLLAEPPASRAEHRFWVELQKQFGAKRHIFEDKGGEAQIAEPPASGQNIAS
jgi:hypothetical protein